MKLTINQAIAFNTQFTKRISELSRLRDQAVYDTVQYNEEGHKIRETKINYDIKVLDKKITNLQNWLFKLESEIKATNARTELSIDVPVDDLMSPIE